MALASLIVRTDAIAARPRAPSPGSIGIWTARPDEVAESQWPSLLRLLDDAERVRAAAFVFETHRRQYVAAHALKRLMLSAAVDGSVGACDWRFVAEPGGKPRAVNAGAPFFNLSHCDGLVACAVSACADVGVDVEPVTRPPPMEVAVEVFAESERAQLEALDGVAQAIAFFRLWTLKEAYIKATGEGLAASLRSFAFDLDTLRIDFDPRTGARSRSWRFAQHRLMPGHVLSLAWEGAAMTPAVEAIRWSGGAD